jgi:hypothetical protein
MIGPGKYDNECTNARKETEAEGAILLIFGGRLGDGFSAQIPGMLITRVPAMLRGMADQIEADLNRGQL